jgi:H+-transporting ATPase
MNHKILNTEEAKKATVNELIGILSSSESGIATSEADKRLAEYGYNEISEKKTSPILKFLSYFWIIFVLLLLNASVGFWQEHKAENAIELLKKKLALKAKVLRDGKWQEIPSKELVPGDVVRVRLGDIIPADIIPADIKLMKGDYLLVDQSALTG